MSLPHLTEAQIEERRKNLQAFREMGMTDDSEFTTTLAMQGEWLATIDAARGQRDKAERLLMEQYRSHKAMGDKPCDCSICHYLKERGLT